MATTSVGLTQVDRLIARAIDLGFKFPPDAKRWALLAWAAESLEAQRNDPRAFERDGFREITRRHFPTTNP